MKKMWLHILKNILNQKLETYIIHFTQFTHTLLEIVLKLTVNFIGK